MKDQYVADINDFAKYAALRALVSGSALPLVVVWMLTPADSTNEGGSTQYLEARGRYRHVDPLVFDQLETIIQSGSRTVRAVEESRILGTATFVRRRLADDLASRRRLLGELWRAAASPSLVFFDPDIGVAGNKVRKGRARSSMYVFSDELADGFRRGHSLVVYQHFPREQREAFLTRALATLRSSCDETRTFALWSSRVAFLVAPQHGIVEPLIRGGRDLASRWATYLRFSTDEQLSNRCGPLGTRGEE